MHILVSEVLTLMVVRFFKMAFPKAIWILFQALTVLFNIDFFHIT